METAGTLIVDSLQDLVVQAAEADLEQSEIQAALRYMNRYMFRLAAGGVNLGFTEVSSTSDPITIPIGALDGLRANLAIMLAPMFDAVITPALQMAANDGERVMYSLGATLQEMQFPDRLPIGSGNENFQFADNEHFYPDRQNDIRSEDNQNIIAEDDTE